MDDLGVPKFEETLKPCVTFCQAQPLSAFVLPENGPQVGQGEVAIRPESCSDLKRGPDPSKAFVPKESGSCFWRLGMTAEEM